MASQAYQDAVCAEVKAVLDSLGQTHGNGAWKSKVLVNDRIADSIFQQIILRPEDYSVLATTTSMATISPTRPRRRWAAWASRRR